MFTVVHRSALAGAALVILTLSPASGYSYGTGYKAAKNHSGGHSGTCVLLHPVSKSSSAYFCRRGDVFHLWDLDSDGRSLGVRWSANGRTGLCRFAGGFSKAGDCNYDFPEGTPVSFHAGVCNQTRTVNRRTWSQYTNRTTRPAVINA